MTPAPARVACWRRDSDDERLPYANALEGLRAIVDRGGRVVFGDGIWSTPPTPEATSAVGGRDDEMVDLATLVDYSVDAEFMPLRVSEAPWRSGTSSSRRTGLATRVGLRIIRPTTQTQQPYVHAGNVTAICAGTVACSAWLISNSLRTERNVR